MARMDNDGWEILLPKTSGLWDKPIKLADQLGILGVEAVFQTI